MIGTDARNGDADINKEQKPRTAGLLHRSLVDRAPSDFSERASPEDVETEPVSNFLKSFDQSRMPPLCLHTLWRGFFYVSAIEGERT